MQKLNVRGKKSDKSAKKFIAFVIFFAVMFLGYFNVLFDSSWFLNRSLKLIRRNKEDVSNPKLHQSYFQSNDFDEMDLLINTSSCKIPNFDPWISSVLPHFAVKYSPEQNCKEKFYKWTHSYFNETTDESILVLNTTAIEKDGYSLSTISCCYVTISRGTQPDDSYDILADEMQNYSSCENINAVETVLPKEFYMIVCKRKFLILKLDVLYRGFHAFTPRNRSLETSSKFDHWQTTKSKVKENKMIPPNVLILGIDSTSRLNFRRHMHKTKQAVEDIGAVEMFGYTKVGDNTYPNVFAFLTGYDTDDLRRMCWKSWDKKLDDCPWIFHRFNQANYITSIIEDSPFSTGFNHKKTGFLKQIVDYYFRPFMIAVHDYEFISRPLHIRDYYEGCVSYRTNDEALTDYAESVMKTSNKSGSPAFVMLWGSATSHDVVTGIQTSDDIFENLISRLKSKGLLENTIVFFMSDHGYRYGNSRQTLSGFFEDKLPNLWIRLPKNIQEKFPEWQDALHINSRRLTSPYTLYGTMKLILDTFTLTKEYTNNNFPRQYKQNFLQPVLEDNTCSSVGVPDIYCACHFLQVVNLDDPILLDAATIATNSINKDLVSDCSTLTVSKITAGAVMNKTSTELTYVIAFLTTPGDFLFEAQVIYFSNRKKFGESPDVQRANKINPSHTNCINKHPVLELICFCKN